MNEQPDELVIAGARLLGRDRPVDVVVRDGVVVEITEAAIVHRTAVRTVDAAGGLMIPGLHDHHVHVVATAASATSVDCAPPQNRAQFEDALRAAATSTPDGWVRGVGYFETVAGPLDRHVLDDIVGHVAVRVLHRSGTVWFCNSAALHRLEIGERPDLEGVDLDGHGTATGRLFRLDAWLRDRVPHRVPDLKTVGGRLLAHGVTELTDATPAAANDTLLDEAIKRGEIVQRVHTMAAPANRTGRASAVKLLLDDRDPPSFDDLCVWIADAHDRELPVAVHLTDRATTWLALAAWQHVGARPGDRVEHGSVIDADAVDRMRAYGLAVVTNPSLAALRGDDHRRDVEPDDVAHLWRCGSLLDVGIAVFGGTDAPYGPLNPWRAMADAVVRRTPSGAPIGDDRPLTPGEALSLFAGSGRIGIGQGSDAVVLSVSTVEAALSEPDRADLVTATVLGGSVVWAR